MAPFDTILSTSVGTNAFQLLSYTRSGRPRLDSEGKRRGTEIRFTLDGEVQAADAAGLASALAAFAADLEAAEATDFSISAHGALKEQLVADDLLEGPHFAFEYAEAGGHNVQPVRVGVEAVRASDPGEDGVASDTTTYRYAVDHEGLASVAIAGRVETDGDPAASTVVLEGVGEEPMPKVPERPEGFRQTYEYETDSEDKVCSWRVVQAELAEEYPVDPDVPTDRVVDGERTVATTFDRHNRQVTHYHYDYRGAGAEGYVSARHDALREGGGLVRARISATGHQQTRVVGDFEVVAARQADGPLELAETISHARSGPVLEERRYPGTTPLLVQAAEAAWVYEQSGRAVGLSEYPEAPWPKFDQDHLAEAPQITLSRSSDQEFETSWRYRFLFTEEQPLEEPGGRSHSPGTY